MQVNDSISFITGASIVHVPLQIQALIPMHGNDMIIEIGLFAAKSIVGGLVSIGVAHVANKLKRNKKEGFKE